jgi:hypothetical protein
MKWAARPGVHVDRTACAWLIRRFIDPDAEFAFIPDLAHVPADTTPSDMRGADLSHHDGDCTFETILRRYDLEAPAVWDIARIVHEADLEDERFDAPEARGLDVLIRCLSMVCDDGEALTVSGRHYDGLYEHRRRANVLGREPS